MPGMLRLYSRITTVVMLFSGLFSGLKLLDLDYNLFSQLPTLASAPNLTTMHMYHNTELVLDAASVDRLAAEAPRLRHFGVGGTAAAGARLAKNLPGLTVE